MEYKNTKINILGDSITEGFGSSPRECCFVSLLNNEYGMICRNYGIGGTRIARQKKPSDNSTYDLDFCKRALEMNDDAEIVAVFGGTNDYGHGDAPIGDFSDRTPDTFYGALHYLYKNLIEKFPEAFIFVITPLHRVDDENLKGEGDKAVDVAPLREYVRIIREVAEYYSLPVLDLFADSGIQPNIPVLYKKYTADGVHPNNRGHRLIARRIITFLSQYEKL